MAEEKPDYNAITWPVQLTKTLHRSLYPLLDPHNPDLNAKGKTVLITGATGGIGHAIAHAWTIAGAKGVVITGRRGNVLQDLAGKLQNIGEGRTKVVFVQADITKEEEVKKLWEKAREELGTIDVLINNAGSLTQMRIGEGEVGEWWRDFVCNSPSSLATLSPCFFHTPQATNEGK
jgi:NADP-dependent 3-hydroxy acid dehydrogenase YdfG